MCVCQNGRAGTARHRTPVHTYICMNVCVHVRIGHVLVLCESVRATLVIKFLIYDHVKCRATPFQYFIFGII